MELHDVNVHCERAGYPLLSPAQWKAILATSYGAKLLSQDAEDAGFHPSLELIVRSVSDTARSVLEKNGFVYSVQELLDIVAVEGKKVFVALHKSSTDPNAKNYLASLSLTKREKKSVPAPYYSFHVYGTSGALCFSEAQTRKNQQQSINIEGTLTLGSSKIHYDWANKIIVQLSPEEMFLVLALLNGKLNSIKFTGHGVNNDKVIEMQLQQSHYFVKLIQRGRAPVAVPMQSQHALNLTSLLLAQIKKNHPHLSRDEMMMMEDQLVRMHLAK